MWIQNTSFTGVVWKCSGFRNESKFQRPSHQTAKVSFFHMNRKTKVKLSIYRSVCVFKEDMKQPNTDQCYNRFMFSTNQHFRSVSSPLWHQFFLRISHFKAEKKLVNNKPTTVTIAQMLTSGYYIHNLIETLLFDTFRFIVPGVNRQRSAHVEVIFVTQNCDKRHFKLCFLHVYIINSCHNIHVFNLSC